MPNCVLPRQTIKLEALFFLIMVTAFAIFSNYTKPTKKTHPGMQTWPAVFTQILQFSLAMHSLLCKKTRVIVLFRVPRKDDEACDNKE